MGFDTDDWTSIFSICNLTLNLYPPYC